LIPTAGVFKRSAAALFPAANLADATHIRVQGSGPVAGTSVLSGYLVSPSEAVVNAVSASSSVTQANFPHVISGAGFGGNYTTIVGATNLAGAEQDVSVTFTPTGGGVPITVSRRIPVNGSFRETAQTLFSLSTDYNDGWVRIQGTAALTGFVAYSDSVTRGIAVVSVQATPRSSLLFSHLANGAPWMTGLALLNASGTDAAVEVYAMNPSGSLIGSTSFTLSAGSKRAGLLSGFIPPSAGKEAGFIFVRTSNNVPIYGIELFFTQNLSVLANVAAGAIAPGITFNPPLPQLPFTLSALTPNPVARGATLTLSGSGFSTTSPSTIVFTSISGNVASTATANSSGLITVTVPPTAITGPVVVQSGGQSASTLVRILASPTSVAQNPVTVSAGATAFGMDIYVSTPTTGLNLTDIALLDVGTTGSFFVSPASVEISRGQTKELVMLGSGISQANGTAASISGSGVTISNVRYSSNNRQITVTVFVSANAAPGARNIVLTNSNLDTAVLTGGFLIR
jgi:hypothetical protein